MSYKSDISTLTPLSNEEYDTLLAAKNVEDVPNADKPTATIPEVKEEKPKTDIKEKVVIAGMTQLSDEEFNAELELQKTKDLEAKPLVDTEGKVIEQPKQDDFTKQLAKYFKEELEFLPGLDLDKFDGTVEGLKTALQNEFKEWTDSYEKEMPVEIKYLWDNYKEGVPFDELLNIKSNQIRYESVDADKLDEEGSEGLQKAILTQFYKETAPKWSDAKIAKEVNSKIELGQIDEVKDALAELKVLEAEKAVTLRETTKQEQAHWKKENERTLGEYKELVYGTKEFMPGFEATKQQQDAVYNSTVKPVMIDGNGNPVSRLQKVLMSDPKNTAHMNWYLEVTKDLTDFSYLEKTYTTKATKKLDAVINKSTPTGTSIKAEFVNGTTINSLDSLRKAYQNR